MPTARQEAPRLRAGTVASGSITSTYAITAWTVQSDQTVDNQTAVPWAPPAQMLPPEYVRIARNLDKHARADGSYRGVFGPFAMWTFGMMSYFLSTYLPAGVYSAAASMMFYDVTDTAWYLNATIYRPVVGQDMEPVFGGWGNVRIRYDDGSTAA